MDEQGETEGGVEKLLKDMYSDKNAKQVNKIQHAFYYTPEVLEHLKTLQSGEEAIKFFATYGNSTPIKYINCIRADSIKDESDNIGPPKPFRPYDLLVFLHFVNSKAKCYPGPTTKRWRYKPCRILHYFSTWYCPCTCRQV